MQIHHIDVNPSNNEISNLCVLCIEHHAEASTKSSMVKGLSALLLKKYKADWEGLVARKRQVRAAARSQRASQGERREVAMEIKRVVFALNGPKSAKDVNAAIDYLYMWSIMESRRKEIIEAFEITHWFVEFVGLRIVVRRLHEFFWEFIGPEKVPMNAKNEKELVAGVTLLGSFGVQGAIFEADEKFFRELTKAFNWFAETAILYKRDSIKRVIAIELKKIRKECEDHVRETPGKMKLAIAHIDRCLASISKSSR